MKNGPNRIGRKKMDRMEGKMDRIAYKKGIVDAKKKTKKMRWKSFHRI